MKKFIVDAPELKDGQTYSSGGIRENGKISVQYKNPVPYVEPKEFSMVCNEKQTKKELLKEQAEDFVIEMGKEIISMFWHEYGKPFFQTKFRELALKTNIYLEDHDDSKRIINSDRESSQIIDAQYTVIKKDQITN